MLRGLASTGSGLTPTCNGVLRGLDFPGRTLRRGRRHCRAAICSALSCPPMAHEPTVVALYPTRGLDARGTIAVRTLLRDPRDRGAAVLLISEDLDELFELATALWCCFTAPSQRSWSGDFRAEVVGPPMVGLTEHADAA